MIPHGREVRRLLHEAGLLRIVPMQEQIALLREPHPRSVLDGLIDLRWIERQTPVTAEALAGRDGTWPNPLFDPEFYLSRDPGLRGLDWAPLAHFVMHGEDEGRLPCLGYDPRRGRLREQLFTGGVSGEAIWPADVTTRPVRLTVSRTDVHDLDRHRGWAAGALGGRLVRRRRWLRSRDRAWSGPGGVAAGAWLAGDDVRRLAEHLQVQPAPRIVVTEGGIAALDEKGGAEPLVPLPATLRGWLSLGQRIRAQAADVTWNLGPDHRADLWDGSLLSQVVGSEDGGPPGWSDELLWSARRVATGAMALMPEAHDDLSRQVDKLEGRLVESLRLNDVLRRDASGHGEIWLLVDAVIPQGGHPEWELVLVLARWALAAGRVPRVVMTLESSSPARTNIPEGRELARRFDEAVEQAAAAAYPPEWGDIGEAMRGLRLTSLPGAGCPFEENRRTLDEALLHRAPAAVLSIGVERQSRLWLRALAAARTVPVLYVPGEIDSTPPGHVDLILDPQQPPGRLSDTSQGVRLGYRLPPLVESYTGRAAPSRARVPGRLALTVGSPDDLDRWAASVSDRELSDLLDALLVGGFTWEVIGARDWDTALGSNPSFARAISERRVVWRASEPALVDYIRRADLLLNPPWLESGSLAVGYAVAQDVPVISGPTVLSGFLPREPAATMADLCSMIRDAALPTARRAMVTEQRHHRQIAGMRDHARADFERMLESADRVLASRGGAL